MKRLWPWLLGGAGLYFVLRGAWVSRAYFKSRGDFVRQVSAAVRRVAPEFDLKPQPTDLFVTAHAAISSGWGGIRNNRGVGGWNLWGMKAGRTWTGPTFQARGFERVNGVKVYSMMTWKAFDGPDGSVREYLKTVSKPGYAESFEKLDAGDLNYMAQLGRDGWYTAEISEVSAMFKSIVASIEGMLGY